MSTELIVVNNYPIHISFCICHDNYFGRGAKLPRPFRVTASGSGGG